VKLWVNGQAEQVSVIGLLMMLLVILFRWIQGRVMRAGLSTL
jgi:iron(III) transport system permease protein